MLSIHSTDHKILVSLVVRQIPDLAPLQIPSHWVIVWIVKTTHIIQYLSLLLVPDRLKCTYGHPKLKKFPFREIDKRYPIRSLFEIGCKWHQLGLHFHFSPIIFKFSSKKQIAYNNISCIFSTLKSRWLQGALPPDQVQSPWTPLGAKPPDPQSHSALTMKPTSPLQYPGSTTWRMHTEHSFTQFSGHWCDPTVIKICWQSSLL